MNKEYKQPSYYQLGKFEAKEIIELIASRYDGYAAFLVGNILKYLIRATFKGTFKLDILKANEYMQFLVTHIGGNESE